MANNRVQVKRTSTTGRTPNTTGSYATNSQYISAGELALNMADGILYSSNGSAVIEIGANNTNLNTNGNITLTVNNKQLKFATVNTSAYAYFTQQSDDNFVFYTTNTAYGTRPVWSIFANSITSNLNFSAPVNFSANIGLGTNSLTANGTVGSAGQYLTSNGSATYWSTPGVASVNTAAQYSWTNTHTFSANVSFTGNGIGLTTNTAAIYFAGTGDANWKMGRNTNAITKWIYTNNSVDIAIANSNLEGFVIGNAITKANTYFETGHLGTYIALSVTIGNTSSNSTINSTAISANSITIGAANTATFTNINGQVNASSNFTGNAYAYLSGYGGNYLAFGQQTNFAQWIQSGFPSAGSPVYYSIILNPLGGNVGIGNTAPVDRLSVNGNTYFGANLTVAGANLIVSTGVISGNGASITSVNAIALNGQPASYYTNATNITTGTLPYAQIPANIVNTTGSFTLSGNNTFAGTNTTISSNLNITGSFMNVASAFVVNSTGAYHTGTINAASHTVGTSTIANSTGVYTGVVNGSSLTVGTSFTANATVVNAVSYYAGTTLIGNTTGPYGKTEINLNVNSALTANNSTNLGGTAAAGYQTTAGLSANVATLSANNSSFLGGTAAASYQLNSTLNANIASYLPNYTGVVNGSSHTVGSSFTANATGVYHTGTVNAASHTVGTTFTANATLVNAAALNVVANTTTNNLSVSNKILVGTAAGYDFGSLASIEIDASQNTYVQSVIQNANSGTNASGDLVITADTGNDSVDYVDFGINSSNYTNTIYSVVGAKDAYLYTSNGNFAIGTATGKELIFHANGTTSADRKLTVNATHVIIANTVGLLANGSDGNAGDVLTSNGNAVYWAPAAAGVNTAAQYSWTNTHTFNSNTTVGNATFANTFLNSYTGISNPQSLTAGVLQTNASLNTLLVGPYTIASGNSLVITSGSRLVIV